jgi:EpsI family protein
MRRILCSILLMACTVIFIKYNSLDSSTPLRKSFGEFPDQVGNWRLSRTEMLNTWVLDNLRLNDYLMRYYTHPDGSTVQLFIGFWEMQRKGAQIHSPKNCLPGSGWEPVQSSIQELTGPSPNQRILTNRILVQKDQSKQFVYYWYQSQGKAVLGEAAARIEMVKNALLHQRTDAALIRISGHTQTGDDKTDRRIKEFIQLLYPILNDYLPS